MTVAENLRERARLIRSGELRWVSRGPGHGECCLITGDDPIFMTEGVWRTADGAIRRVLGRQHIALWNDRHCKSAEQAADVLERAAVWAEAHP